MQYVLGLRQLGCEVYWLECFRSKGRTEREDAALARFRARRAAGGPDKSSASSHPFKDAVWQPSGRLTLDSELGVKDSRCQEVFTHLCKKPFSGSVCLVSSVSKNQRSTTLLYRDQQN